MVVSRFSLRLEAQRKAPKETLNTGLRAPTRATVRGAPPLKRWTKQSHKANTNISTNQNLNKHTQTKKADSVGFFS